MRKKNAPPSCPSYPGSVFKPRKRPVRWIWAVIAIALTAVAAPAALVISANGGITAHKYAAPSAAPGVAQPNPLA